MQHLYGIQEYYYLSVLVMGIAISRCTANVNKRDCRSKHYTIGPKRYINYIIKSYIFFP